MPEPAPVDTDHYVHVADLTEIPTDRPLRVVTDDGLRILVRTDAGVTAFDAICTHQFAELWEGEVEDGVIWCALHGAGFDATSGQAICPPAVDPLRRYDVVVDGTDVYVARDSSPWQA